MKILEHLQSIIKSLGSYLLYFGEKFYQSPRQKSINEWNDANGDKTFRITYNLNSDSIVFDVGGYEGQWASDIFAKYCCHIFIFEPVKSYAYYIQQRFNKNKKIKVYDFGLGERTETKVIYVDKNSTSFFKKNPSSIDEEADIVSISEFIRDNKIETIDLMKINIEGGEYNLILNLIDNKQILKIKNLQIQFHIFYPNAIKLREKIQNELRKTHEMTFNFPWVWENWRLYNHQ